MSSADHADTTQGPATSAAPDQEMASVDQATGDLAMSAPRGAGESNSNHEDEVSDAQDSPIVVEDDDGAEQTADRPTTAAAATGVAEQATSGSFASRRRVTARGFETNDAFTFADQERRAEDRLLDERVRERYTREIGDPFDERGAAP